MTEQIHIAVLTGKRGGYGAMKPMLQAMKSNEKIKLSLIVTDQHVNEKFGSTISEIENDFSIAAVADMEQKDASSLQRSKALGVCLMKMSDILSNILPDIIVLYGDRGEVLSTALAAVTLRIPIAHIQGGDVSGNVDEVMRHAITKLSHLHYPSTSSSAKRILAMGEESWRVKVVGDNHVDSIVSKQFTDQITLEKKYSISSSDDSPIIVLLHPETTRLRDGYSDMKLLLDIVLREKRRTFVVYPCSDHGYDGIIRAINECQGHSKVSIHKNIDANDFWGLMNISSLIIGNSSAGLIEAPYFKLPAINLGERQLSREHGKNVIHAPFDSDKIYSSIKKALYDLDFIASLNSAENPFGDGDAWYKIVNHLMQVEVSEKLFNKRFVMNSEHII